eukprot:TRINITY_DN69111_c0_g1_i1.p1 TRINITY_DN69111_c0_g1~~TRINITY_DN69111_c0_g1_i1.p1  ORF type:complete len:214 (+),score=24.66 TRINITY_DN69111_c0_g1_i1:143-784(+)
MAHCTDTRCWRDFIDHENTTACQRRKDYEHASGEEDQLVAQFNPYNTERPFFTRGRAHMLYNDSSRARMVLAPYTSDPLKTAPFRHHMFASRRETSEHVRLREDAASADFIPSPAQRSVSFVQSPPSVYSSSLGTTSRETERTQTTPRSGRFAAERTLHPARGLRQASLSARRSEDGKLHRRSAVGRGPLATPRRREAHPQRAVAYGKMVLPL